MIAYLDKDSAAAAAADTLALLSGPGWVALVDRNDDIMSDYWSYSIVNGRVRITETASDDILTTGKVYCAAITTAASWAAHSDADRCFNRIGPTPLEALKQVRGDFFDYATTKQQQLDALRCDLAVVVEIEDLSMAARQRAENQTIKATVTTKLRRPPL